MASPDDPTDRDLMLAVRDGELSALDALFVRHHGRVHGFLARLTGDRDAADDLVQDVFLRVLKYRDRYAGDGEFITWLFRIARNVAATDHGRQRAAEPLLDDANESTDDSALDELVAAEDHEQLARALAALPFAHREVLLLRGTEGLTHRAAADALGCTEGAARVRLFRALNALKREWLTLAGEVR